MSFVKKRLRPRLLLLYALAAALVYFATPNPIVLVAGCLLVLAGEAIRIWATGYLHKNDALTVSGPYAFVRHPLYLGSLLIGCGFALMGANAITWILLAGFLAFYFFYYMPYKNRIEGARLEALYGETFRRYAAAVPRLLPRVHPYVPLPADRSAMPVWNGARFADNNEIGTALTVGVGLVAMVTRWSLS